MKTRNNGNIQGNERNELHRHRWGLTTGPSTDHTRFGQESYGSNNLVLLHALSCKPKHDALQLQE